jgi:hypothetical protein
MATLNPLAPFVDDALIELRVKQRKLLAGIPDWVVEGLLHNMATTDRPLSSIGGRAEQRLRELAATEMVGAQVVLERAGKAAAAGEVLDVLDQWVNSAGGDAAELLEGTFETLRSELAAMPGPDEDLRPMNRMVVLLDLADRVATDGYRDARLDAGPTPGT